MAILALDLVLFRDRGSLETRAKLNARRQRRVLCNHPGACGRGDRIARRALGHRGLAAPRTRAVTPVTNLRRGSYDRSTTGFPYFHDPAAHLVTASCRATRGSSLPSVFTDCTAAVGRAGSGAAGNAGQQLAMASAGPAKEHLVLPGRDPTGYRDSRGPHAMERWCEQDGWMPGRMPRRLHSETLPPSTEVPRDDSLAAIPVHLRLPGEPSVMPHARNMCGRARGERLPPSGRRRCHLSPAAAQQQRIQTTQPLRPRNRRDGCARSIL